MKYNFVSKDEAEYFVSAALTISGGYAYGKLYDKEGNIAISANAAYILRQMGEKQYPVWRSDVERLVRSGFIPKDLQIEEEPRKVKDVVLDCLSALHDKIDWVIQGKEFMVIHMVSKNSAKKVSKRMLFKSLQQAVQDLQSSRESKRVAITWEGERCHN